MHYCRRILTSNKKHAQKLKVSRIFQSASFLPEDEFVNRKIKKQQQKTIIDRVICQKKKNKPKNGWPERRHNEAQMKTNMG